MQFRNIPDNASPVEYEELIKKVVGDGLRADDSRSSLCPGGRLGTKKDAQDHLAYMQDLSAAVKKAAPEGKCIDNGDDARSSCQNTRSGPTTSAALPMNIERYCYWWSNGY